MRTIIIVLSIIIILNQDSFALVADSLETDQSASVSIFDDAKNFFNTGIGLATSPFAFNSSDWINAGLVTAGTVSLFTIDKSVRELASKNQSELNNKLFNFDAFYGNAYTALFTASIYGFGILSNNKGIRNLGLNSFEAFFYSGLITGILKVSIGRRRPYAGDSHLYFKPFQLTDNDFQSLPSGHTTVSFAVSTVLAQYLDNIFWKVFWYGAAGMVSLSRVYHNQHWFSDIFLGAAIGYFVGQFIVNQNTETSSRITANQIKPYFGLNRIGIVFMLK